MTRSRAARGIDGRCPPVGFAPGAMVRVKARPELTGVITQVDAVRLASSG